MIAAGKLTVSDPAMSEQFARFVEERYPYADFVELAGTWLSAPPLR